MQRGERTGPEIRRMRRELHAALARERRHLQEFGDAAHLGDRRLSILNSIEQRGELGGEAAVLARRNRDTSGLTYRAQTQRIFRREHRLLEPLQAERREPPADRDRL